ncbi:MAG: hypothetical protein LBH44_07490 [Treponema sp.]|jgi:hypothetical protein|nr:hypothetical protein [Treponema sp.]
MNTFNLDTEQLDLDEARAALSGCHIERLPNVPPFLSKKECSVVLGVSMKVINKLIESGQLPLTDIPDDSQPVSFDLFGEPINPPREEVILRADLIVLFEKLLVFHKPILKPKNE